MSDIACKAHSNLYYLFAADKKEHPMPPHRVELLRKMLFA